MFAEPRNVPPSRTFEHIVLSPMIHDEVKQLDPNTTYFFSVRARTSKGYGETITSKFTTGPYKGKLFGNFQHKYILATHRTRIKLLNVVWFLDHAQIRQIWRRSARPSFDKIHMSAASHRAVDSRTMTIWSQVRLVSELHQDFWDFKFAIPNSTSWSQYKRTWRVSSYLLRSAIPTQKSRIHWGGGWCDDGVEGRLLWWCRCDRIRHRRIPW